MRKGVDHQRVPRVSGGMVRVVGWYFRRLLRGSFHAVRVVKGRGVRALEGEGPVVVYVNHPSWWDPVVLVVVARAFYPGRRHFGAMDAGMLKKYRFFRGLGLFGVEQGTVKGARDFLETVRAVIGVPRAMVWVTAQGRFADVRERPVRLEGGIGHVVREAKGVRVIPLAIEYALWAERRGEVLLCFGEAVDVGGAASAKEATGRLETALERAQDELAAAAMTRDARQFEVLMRGRGGVHPVYDVWRRMVALVRGETFRPDHGGEE